MQTLTSLTDQFAQDNNLTFVQTGDLLIAELRNQHGFASVALQGAQVLQWLPTGQEKSVIWVSSAAVYQTGKGVRGGAPVCWPWFGAVEGKPAHGFVRTRLWQVTSTRHTENETAITLTIQDDDSSRALWNYGFTLNLTLTLSTELTIALETNNTGSEDFTITEALHTYFEVGDLAKMQVVGLDGVSYLDKVQGMNAFTQSGNIQMNGEEVDRVYLDTNSDVVIEDTLLNRQIMIGKQQAPTTIVWNPGVEKEKGFADMAEGDYRKMLCVESGTAGNTQASVPANSQHCLMVVYRLQAL
jgi:glucose-6-phosphate 1-epimerase